MNWVRAAIGTILILSLTGVSPLAATSRSSLKKTSASQPRSALVDVNRATVSDLESLPGIGQAYAEKIVKYRPYANKAQLLSKGVLPAATYKTVRSLIIAKQ